jgi:uncharacterized protein (DUF433 family)
MAYRNEALFPGTRVPVRTLLDWLAEGETVAEFLRYFPAVTRAQALEALAEKGVLSRERLAAALEEPRPDREREE